MVFYPPSFQQEKILFRKMLYRNAARVAQSGSDVWTDSFITLLFPRESTHDLFSKSDPDHASFLFTRGFFFFLLFVILNS